MHNTLFQDHHYDLFKTEDKLQHTCNLSIHLKMEELLKTGIGKFNALNK